MTLAMIERCISTDDTPYLYRLTTTWGNGYVEREEMKLAKLRRKLGFNANDKSVKIYANRFFAFTPNGSWEPLTEREFAIEMEKLKQSI